MESLAQIPQPHIWQCEECGEPLQLWYWGSYYPPTLDSANAIIPPPARCYACLIDQTAPEHKGFVHWLQSIHHDMRDAVGEPPGTLIVWQVPLRNLDWESDKSGKQIQYPATIYVVRVDWWDDRWPQRKVPWCPERTPLLVVLGAHVIASGDEGPIGEGSWVFSWWWPDPSRREMCRLEPPYVSLTDDEVVRLNHARRAFYAFAGRRGRKPGSRSVGPSTKAEWHEVGARVEAAWLARNDQRPRDVDLAEEMGISAATFYRLKREWGHPTRDDDRK
jgi:hypothetical protein